MCSYYSVSSNRYLADEVSYLATQGDATRFVEGEYPEGIGQMTNVAILGLFTSKHSEGFHTNFSNYHMLRFDL